MLCYFQMDLLLTCLKHNMLKTQELAYFLFKTMPLYLNSHSMSPFPIILPRCPLYAACLFYFDFLSPPSCNLCLPLGNHTFIKKIFDASIFRWISDWLILKMWIYSWENMCAQQASWKPFTWLGDEQVVSFFASIANDFYYISSQWTYREMS